MFENIIEQGAVLQLQEDILSGRLAPSMLFYGPSESGKGSAALELARILSCTADASWKCKCSACESHRYLQHPDLLILGSRSFAAEIAASCSAFLRNPAAVGTKTLFIRSFRKLQIRFSPVLLEDDPKLSKLSSPLQS
ncbi:MAG: DNA polymerase III, partial [Treponema sp.]|nr:DNA polymerase III [Treponema sp.]